MTEKERQDFALAQLDRTLGFIPRAEAKVTAVFPVAIAMLAILALNLPVERPCSWLVVAAFVAATLAAGCLTICLVRTYETLFPRLAAPRASLIFFGEVGKLGEQEYVDRLRDVAPAEVADDAASQIWRNSEIAGIKFGKAKATFHWLAGALVPWLAFLVLVMAIGEGKLPALGAA